MAEAVSALGESSHAHPRLDASGRGDLSRLPLFLTPEFYILVPLDTTYRSAWDAVPAFWREALASASPTATGGRGSKKSGRRRR
jgi:hypothetical protein